jgi:oligosaccharide repeat unit polymerase
MIRSTRSSIWWLNPACVFTVAGVGISAAAYAIPESIYRTYWRMPKFFDGSTFEITLFCVAVFVFGSMVGARLNTRINGGRARSGRWDEAIPWDSMLFLFRLSFWLCTLGYVFWIVLAIQRGITPEVVLGIVTGEKGAMYDARYTYLQTVGGITTLTQFGTAAMIFGALIGQSRGWKIVRWKLAVIFLFAAARAVLNSERFAMIELAVPFLLTCLALRYFDRPEIGGRIRFLVRLAPVIGVVTLFFLFTGMEYFRSWTNYYAGRDLSLWEFGAMRLLGYYVTSFSNGGYLLRQLETLNAPYFTLHFLWGFPLTGPLIKRVFSNPILESGDKWFYFPFLESGANVEFNNADGMLFPLMDFGIAGGLLYWLAMGLVCGAVYQSFRRLDLTGLLLYPVLFLGLMEVPLALFWSEGRAFPAVFLLAASAVYFAAARPTPVKTVTLTIPKTSAIQ